MSDGLVFSTDAAAMDVGRVHRWLAEESYWARGRAREAHEAAMAGSRNYGVFDAASGVQLGYARAITDGATFAWIADVFVDPESRGRGVGKRIMAGILTDLEPLGLKRTALFTEDAHGLYEQFGFQRITDAESWMLRWGAGYGPAGGGPVELCGDESVAGSYR
ncbi:GNAT family N-acetyltransferase [Microbacterium gallinarum]|uniref:GNAT family N-acetyltransferase n=1 Tax=Microbacterium gallinarum TaxID=2762209 RepID=A0ABR8WYG6_9MICO|nr:GNAT family N-acetyltransferase [Microbacterium gallinarum]MBD8022127.1 GNAT family N-acetyltransferase [Microbacterium gallinarum]